MISPAIATAATAASAARSAINNKDAKAPRKNIIRKAVEKIKSPVDDYEKSLKLIDKHKLPTVYGAVGSDFVHGAASMHDDKIKLKHAYTPKTIATRTWQRALIGGALGAGMSYYHGSRNEDLAKNAGGSALIGAAIGATAGPATFYLAGKALEAYKNRNKNKNKGNKK